MLSFILQYYLDAIVIRVQSTAYEWNLCASRVRQLCIIATSYALVTTEGVITSALI